MVSIPKSYFIYCETNKFRMGYDTFTLEDIDSLVRIVKPKKKNKEKVFKTVYIYTPKKLSVKFYVD